MRRNSREIIQEVVQRSAESVEDFLQWSQEHQGCTLSELEQQFPFWDCLPPTCKSAGTENGTMDRRFGISPPK